MRFPQCFRGCEHIRSIESRVVFAALHEPSATPKVTSSNQRSILVMAIWPSSAFTSGIYRVCNPQSTLHLAALFHVSVSSRIGTRNGAESW